MKNCRQDLRFCLASLAVFAAIYFTPIPVLAQTPQPSSTYTVLHYFTQGSDGSQPTSGLTIDRGDNFYGTAGGETAFRLARTSSGWIKTPIYQFNNVFEGEYPNGELTLGRDGQLFGATLYGGPSCGDQGGCGAFFRLQPSATICGAVVCPWSKYDLYQFTDANESVGPNGRMVEDSAGTFYATAMRSGSYYAGQVIALSPSGGGYTGQAIYTFTGGLDGGQPVSGLIADPAGNLYGTAISGGLGWGTIFKLSRQGDAWALSTLHVFRIGSDGGDPQGGLIMDAAGNLFGTTYTGGPDDGGTVFELSPAQNGSWQFSVLTYFSGNGIYRLGPTGALAMDGHGNVYGTTSSEGDFSFGNVFQLSHTDDGWLYRDLHSFTGPDGQFPYGSVVLDRDGNVYGTARNGGLDWCDCGVIWQVTP